MNHYELIENMMLAIGFSMNRKYDVSNRVLYECMMPAVGFSMNIFKLLCQQYGVV